MVRKRDILSTVAVTALIVSCGSSELTSDNVSGQTDNVQVGITCSTQEAQSVVTRAGSVGAIKDDSDLQRFGIGTFAYYTGTNDWASAGATTAPNFMYNQYVEYRSVGVGVYGWVYSPVKYWPNDVSTGAVDDNGATGSENGGKLSFFAYAPYSGNSVKLSDVTYTFEPSSGRFKSTADAYYDDQAKASNIIKMTSNSTNGAPVVTYKWDTDPDNQVDLLWGTRASTTNYNLASGGSDTGSESKTVNTDLTKQTTSEKVDFKFKHTLSAIDVYVRRVYDEVSVTDRHPDNDADTKIFVSEVRLTPSSMYELAQLNLYSGAWSGYDEQGTTPIVFGENTFTDKIRGTKNEAMNYIRVYELDKWNMNDANGNPVTSGVTEEETRLMQASHQMMFIPQTMTLTPQITYSFVTKDNTLQLDYLEDSSGNRFNRIVNTVTGADISSLTFEGGKKYLLLCSIGVEHVTFEIKEVEDWDFPIRYTNEVVTPTNQEITKTVTEE